MRLLIADDEINLAKALQAVLIDAGYNCDVCFDGNSAIHLVSQEMYDGLILDIMMPEKNGYEVLSMIRKKKIDIPVLLLSALNEVDDKVIGFDLGANDYLSKPFSTKELIARIKVMLKENIMDDSYLQYQDIILNKKEETLSCKNTKYQLSKYESSILSLLIRSESNRVPIWLVIEKVWDNRVNVNPNTVSLYVSYLNRKLLALSSKAHIEINEENIELCVNI
ncbi:response regulator transcription factor [uncultured Holdemanella sp.]|mgnify:FL=1|uniref:response regulator transcription factor n=1 Tax=uncultured Holdemanella sp. TaxID=1763549 RepID=UPI0025E2DB70|nr:response regulator transcription factor [uncultured Holdemanella sp.]